MAKAKTGNYLVIDGPIQTHDTVYEIGETIELTVKEAAGLSQFLEPVKDSTPADSGKTGSDKK